jgi:UDP-MurNAc hydroxylase
MILKFLNHASYLIENDDFIFISDPWMEGAAFNNGWKLLDQTTSNFALVDFLKLRNKKTFIWYSHEHSDHFSVSFIKLAKSQNIDLHVLFQDSLDQRVFNFLTKMCIATSILMSGDEFQLNYNCSIRIWTWKSGDSFSIMNLGGVHILNLNDCIVKNDADSLLIKELINSPVSIDIDILFSQFGYASWCGNEDNVIDRRNQASEKCDRLLSQINILKPKSTILFASFVYFSHQENFYLNDEQNSPHKIRSHSFLNKLSSDIFFLKPNDLVDINSNFKDVLSELTVHAEQHWQKLIDNLKPDISFNQNIDSDKIQFAFENYRNRVGRAFLYIFFIAEVLYYIKPLRIKIVDLNRVAHLSYIHGLHFDERMDDFDLSMGSDVLLFTIERDYGFDSTQVSGRFRVGNNNGDIKAMYFFGPQNLLKNGFGINSPIKTLKEFYRLARR